MGRCRVSRWRRPNENRSYALVAPAAGLSVAAPACGRAWLVAVAKLERDREFRVVLLKLMLGSGDCEWAGLEPT